MGFRVYSLLWVMQGLYHQPYLGPWALRVQILNKTSRRNYYGAHGRVYTMNRIWVHGPLGYQVPQ